MIFEQILRHHTAFSILAGFLLDCLLGDPHCFPHPVRFMGKLISFLERRLNKNSDSPKMQIFKGFLLVFAVIFVSFSVTTLILLVSKKINPILFTAVESILCYQCIAARSLCHESMKVWKALKTANLENARRAVSMIVGRDTDILDEKGITKAAVETIAENTSDGVVCPLFFMAIFGCAGGIVYKAVNTMDSMIAYKNEKYFHFGFAAAKLDDIANFIPARLCAILMIFCSFVLPNFDSKNALRIFLRDRKKHASPNSAQTESVMAGALGVQLAGDTVYNGIAEKKEFIGEKTRKIETNDIARANTLMYATSIVSTALFVILRIIF